jgi:hypothetical protein
LYFCFSLYLCTVPVSVCVCKIILSFSTTSCFCLPHLLQLLILLLLFYFNDGSLTDSVMCTFFCCFQLHLQPEFKIRNSSSVLYNKLMIRIMWLQSLPIWFTHSFKWIKNWCVLCLYKRLSRIFLNVIQLMIYYHFLKCIVMNRNIYLFNDVRSWDDHISTTAVKHASY